MSEVLQLEWCAVLSALELLESTRLVSRSATTGYLFPFLLLVFSHTCPVKFCAGAGTDSNYPVPSASCLAKKDRDGMGH